jgi:diguanylate cyclase (GGDEF)-like protein
MGPPLSHDRLHAIIETQNQLASSSLEAREVITLVAAQAHTLTASDAAVVELLEGEEVVYRSSGDPAADFQGVRLHARSGPSGRRLRRDEILQCSDASRDHRVDQAAASRAGVRSIVSVPLVHRGQILGALKLYSHRPNAFGEEDVRFLQLLSGLLAPHLAYWHESQRRQAESTIDALTQLPNRRAFVARLGAEVARVRRHGGELSLCLIDVDEFHAVNDTLGRVVGDEVLRGVARNLAQVRGEDEMFRTGADEFTLVFSGVDVAGAEAAARRLAASVLSDRGCGGVTVSWGVAGLDGADPVALLSEAEAALALAKRAGSI